MIATKDQKTMVATPRRAETVPVKVNLKRELFARMLKSSLEEWEREFIHWQREFEMLTKLAQRRVMEKLPLSDKAKDAYQKIKHLMETNLISWEQSVGGLKLELNRHQDNWDQSIIRSFEKYHRLNQRLKGNRDNLRALKMEFLEQLYQTVPVVIF